MLSWLLAAWLGCVSVGWLLGLRRADGPVHPAGSAPDTVLTRMAVHEAGHAVAAWFCTTVREVHKVSILDPDGPAVFTTERSDEDPGALWCGLVIKLAGVAAEGIVFRRWRSLSARGDLAIAREIASKLLGRSAPWRVSPLAVRFDAAFSEPLAPAELHALQVGFAKARQVLLERQREHCRLVGALLHRGRLSQRELSEVLGTRAFVHLVGLWGRCDFARKTAIS